MRQKTPATHTSPIACKRWHKACRSFYARMTTENEERLMSEIARLEAQLALYRELAYHDALTQLHNRRFFEERLAEELSRADRNVSRVVLVMLDLDDFKRINDLEGHAAGDEVLRWVARVLLSEKRASDTVCR